MATSILDEPRQGLAPQRPFQTSQGVTTVAVYLGPALVLIAATVLALTAYARFLEAPPQLWTNSIHDRNSHYLLSLNMALHARQGKVIEWLRDFDGYRMWCPLYSILASLPQTAFGPDYRLAVLPNLLAWVGTALLGFLTARRMVAQGGNLAGLAAAIFILASPAHQGFAVDCMLESLGACLSMLVLFLYLVTKQDSPSGCGRALALALTLLFLCKYNYWLLALLPIGAAELVTRRAALETLGHSLRQFDWRHVCRRQLRQPLSYLFVVVAGAAITVMVTGGGAYQVAGVRISLTTPDNLIHVAYILAFVQLVFWWRRAGRSWTARQGANLQHLIYWHAWPVAIWFLWPKKLSYFVKFVSPSNGGQFQQRRGLWHGLCDYLPLLQSDYHLAMWSFLLVAVLMGIALTQVRSLRRGAVVVVFFVLIALLLTCKHPNRESRFLHTWAAGLWVVAGVGLARLLYGRWSAGRLEPVRPALACATLLGLAVTQLPIAFAGATNAFGGPRFDRPSDLELTDLYLDAFADSHHPAVFSNIPLKQLSAWTFREHYPRRERLVTDIKGFVEKPGQAREIFEHWLKTTEVDTIAFIQIPYDSHFFPGLTEKCDDQLLRLLTEQEHFQLTRRWNMAADSATITLWRRTRDSLDAP